MDITIGPILHCKFNCGNSYQDAKQLTSHQLYFCTKNPQRRDLVIQCHYFSHRHLVQITTFFYAVINNYNSKHGVLMELSEVYILLMEHLFKTEQSLTDEWNYIKITMISLREGDLDSGLRDALKYDFEYCYSQALRLIS